MHYNKEFHLTPYNYLYNHYQCFTTDLSNRLCMGNWLGSAYSSGSASTAKMSKSGTNSLNMQFRRSWVGSQFNSSKYLRSSCCLLFWHLQSDGFSGGPTFIGRVSLFRLFKFTLKPPYSGASERSLLAIWDTSHRNFLSNLDSRQLKTSLMTSYCHFWNLSTFGDSRAIWVFWPKLGVFRKSKFSQWRSDRASMRFRGFR